MKGNIILLLLLIIIGRASGQSFDTTYVDRLVNTLMDTATVTGLQIGIVKNGSVVYLKGYGYRNKALSLENNTNTCFYGASLAKSVFAYLVMQLVDEKLLDLDVPIYHYLPKPLNEYEAFGQIATDVRYKLITPRMCLAHTTGLPNWRETNNGNLQIMFAPGSRYSYSGEGIMLLQLAVESITGQSLTELARKHIFEPFGMFRTDFVWRPAFDDNYAIGHNINEDTLAKVRYQQPYAAGSMETTLRDFTRFMTIVLRGTGLSKRGLEQMLMPQILIDGARQFGPQDNSRIGENRKISLAYGLGWGLFNTSRGKAFFKEGHADGWMHYVIGFPKDKSALVIMANSSNAESIFNELVEKIEGVTIPWYWENYIPYGPNCKLSSDQLENYTGIYEGKIKAIITLENDTLKVQSPTVNLPPTRLYASKLDHFYLKIMDTQLNFIRDEKGRVVKISVNDEGDVYELTKSN